MSHYNLVRKFIPMPQAMKISDAKAAVDEQWKKLETIPPWQLDKVKSRKEVNLNAHRDKKKVHFPTLINICHPKKWGVRTNKSQRQKHESYSEVTSQNTTLEPMQSLLNKAHLLHKSLPQKEMDVIARSPDWDEQAADAVSAYRSSKKYSHRYTWRLSKWLERSRICSQVEDIDEECSSGRTNITSCPCIFGMYSTWMQTELSNTKKSLNHEFLLEQLKNYVGGKNRTQRRLHGPTTWKDMLKNALSDAVNWQTKRQSSCYIVSSPCLDDHHFKKEELVSVGDLSKVCSQFVLRCLYLARIGRPDIQWSVNKLARSVTKWTQSLWQTFGKINFIHSSHKWLPTIYCHVGNTAQHCRIGYIPRLWICWRLWGLEINLGESLMYFGKPNILSPLVGWMCKKQTSVSLSSAESEIISLYAGLRTDGLPALDFTGCGDRSVAFDKQHQNTN